MRARSKQLGVAAFVLVGLGVAALTAPGPIRAYFVHSNLHAVVEGQIYRSGQPSGADISVWSDELGLRSVLNLRGPEPQKGWYREEVRASRENGLRHESLRLRADRMPPSHLLRDLVRALDTSPRPLLFHCKGGVERSGLAASVALLLEGRSLEEARREFALGRGYVGWLSLTDLPDVLDEYEHWLEAQGEVHAPNGFRSWVETVYAPYFYGARIESLSPPGAIAPGEAQVLRFRVTNTSAHPIRFLSDVDRGVKLGARIESLDPGHDWQTQVRGDPVDLSLAPGVSTELELALPALPRAGRYRLTVDLVNEGVKWFEAMGSRPLSLQLRRAGADGSVSG